MQDRRVSARVWIRSDRVSELITLLREAAEITRDIQARRDHLVRGMTRLVGGALAALTTDADFGSGRRGQIVDFAIEGFDANSAPIFHALLHRGTTYHPALRALMRVTDMQARAPVSGSRERFVADPEWNRSEYADTLVTPLGYGASAFGVLPVGPRTVFGSGIMRARGDRPFSDEDLELYRLFIAAAAPLWRKPPVTTLGAKLPPRLRRLFELYLTGASEKEVASRLGLSWETVHTYTREIYRRLGVGSRAQLLAAAFGSRD